MGIVRQRRKTETRVLLVEAGLRVFAERGIELATLEEVAQAAGFTKGAIYRQFRSKSAFLLGLFEQYAAVARAGSGARQASSQRRRCETRCCGDASPSFSPMHPPGRRRRESC